MFTPTQSRNVFFSRQNRLMSLLAWAALALFLVSGALTLPLPGLFALWIPLATLSGWVFFAFWSPQIRWNSNEIQVTNLFRVATIPWQALIHIDTKFSLRLHVPGAHVSAVAAPAPSQMTVLRLARATRNHPQEAGRQTRAGDLLGSDSGDAAALLRREWASQPMSVPVAPPLQRDYLSTSSKHSSVCSPEYAGKSRFVVAVVIPS